SGTLLLVSHDRAFIDNVVTSTLVFEDSGRVNEYVGGYSEWLRQRPAPSAAAAQPKPARSKATSAATETVVTPRLSSAERRELRALPDRIEKIEAQIAAIEAQMAAPGFYDQPEAKTRPLAQQL